MPRWGSRFMERSTLSPSLAARRIAFSDRDGRSDPPFPPFCRWHLRLSPLLRFVFHDLRVESDARLTAVALAATISAVVIAAPDGTQVRGQIDRDTVWSGRLEVTGDVVVASDATLTLNPGTRVAFANGARLTVHGRLLAEGTEKRPVTLTARGELQRGAWHGIVLAPQPDGTDEILPEGSRLSACRIKGAVHTVWVVASASSAHGVASCQITRCRQTGVWLDGIRGAQIANNQITQCGSVDHRPSGAILVHRSGRCQVKDNSIQGCAAYRIGLLQSTDNTVRGNTIEDIDGRKRKPDGFGISLSTASNRNLVLSNHVRGINYMCLYVGDSAGNLIIDNELRNSPDGLGMTGPTTTGNIVRRNRIYGSWWGQIYITSSAHDNLVQDTTVTGGDAGITLWASGPNTFENCVFHGTGPIALLGTSKALFRHCTIRLGVGANDLSTEFESSCELIDCNVRKDHIGFSKGTTDKSQIVFKRTLTVKVVDSESG